ncbi:MAG: HAMP domain-containing protein [Bacteroidota bacterium]
MKSITITEKLIFYFVLIGIVSIVLVGSYSYYFAKEALLNRTFDQLISLRLEKKNRIEQFFLDRNRDLNLISNSEEIKNIIENLNPNDVLKNPIKSTSNNSYLQQFISPYGYFQHLYIVNTTNCVFDLNPNPNKAKVLNIPYDNLKSFCNKLNTSQTTLIQDISKENQFIYIGNPVFSRSKQIVGYVVLVIPVSALNKIMFEHTENNGLGNSGETYLVSNDSLMRSNSRFKGNAVLNIKVTSKSVVNAFSGKTGVDIVQDYRNISCLSSYSKVNIAGLNWVIIAEIDEKEAMTPVSNIRNSILLISIIIAACMFIFAFLLSIRITAPLKKLQRASEQIGEGKYDVKIKVTSKDELGLLTETFNNMVVRLKIQSEEIEEEKTKRISSLLDGQEMERQRLARDLHDSLGQSILTANIKLEQTKNADADKKQQIIFETQELLRQIIQEIRNISNDLMPPILATFGIEKGLKNFCDETSKNTGINIHFSSENLPDTLHSSIQIYLFRITQEAINNIIKHSDANNVLISIFFSQNSIFLSIEDDGKGFDFEKMDTKGNGILNIKERVKSLKGECRFYSTIEKGTQIEIAIPYKI